jgi:hypothetical protein
MRALRENDACNSVDSPIGAELRAGQSNGEISEVWFHSRVREVGERRPPENSGGFSFEPGTKTGKMVDQVHKYANMRLCERHWKYRMAYSNARN